MTARAELFRALGALTESAGPGHAAIARALGLGEPPPGADAEVFLFNTYPYASVYVGAEGKIGGEARDRVAGFWRAIGLVPPAEPDHLAALLGLYAALADAETSAREAGDEVAAARRRRSREVLLWEHLASWLAPYLDKVGGLGSPFHARWAGLLGDAIDREIEATEAPAVLPLHLRAAPGLPDGDAGQDEWIEGLLAPVRTGMVITRSDLRRAASELGLGARVGERAFVLRSLLAQDADGTIRWLADEAGFAAERHGRSAPRLGPVAAFWQARAEACEATLRGVRPAPREAVIGHAG